MNELKPEISGTLDLTGQRTPRPSYTRTHTNSFRTQPRTQEPSPHTPSISGLVTDKRPNPRKRRKPKKLPNTQSTPVELLGTENHRWNGKLEGDSDWIRRNLREKEESRQFLRARKRERLNRIREAKRLLSLNKHNTHPTAVSLDPRGGARCRTSSYSR